MRSTGRLLELVFSLSSFISLDDPRKTLVSPTDSDRIYWLIQSKCIPNFFSATRFYRYPTLRHVLDSQVDDHIFLASWMLTWAILPGLLVILVQHLLLSHLRILRLCFHRLVSVLGPKRATRRLHLPCLLPVVQFNKISIVPKTKCYRIRKINLMIVTLLLILISMLATMEGLSRAGCHVSNAEVSGVGMEYRTSIKGAALHTAL